MQKSILALCFTLASLCLAADPWFRGTVSLIPSTGNNLVVTLEAPNIDVAAQRMKERSLAFFVGSTLQSVGIQGSLSPVVMPSESSSQLSRTPAGAEAWYNAYLCNMVSREIRQVTMILPPAASANVLPAIQDMGRLIWGNALVLARMSYQVEARTTPLPLQGIRYSQTGASSSGHWFLIPCRISFADGSARSIDFRIEYHGESGLPAEWAAPIAQAAWPTTFVSAQLRGGTVTESLHPFSNPILPPAGMARVNAFILWENEIVELPVDLPEAQARDPRLAHDAARNAYRVYNRLAEPQRPDRVFRLTTWAPPTQELIAQAAADEAARAERARLEAERRAREAEQEQARQEAARLEAERQARAAEAERARLAAEAERARLAAEEAERLEAERRANEALGSVSPSPRAGLQTVGIKNWVLTVEVFFSATKSEKIVVELQAATEAKARELALAEAKKRIGKKLYTSMKVLSALIKK